MEIYVPEAAGYYISKSFHVDAQIGKGRSSQY
jgi:hypothetical protein